MKRKIFAPILALAMIFALTACGTSDTPSATPSADTDSSVEEAEALSGDIYVFAASSMTESLDEVIGLFSQENPDVNVIASYDSSGTLKTQIEEGADCDVFISAAQKQMNQLDGESSECEGGNYVLPGSRFDLLENSCVLVVDPNGANDIADWNAFVSLLKSAESDADLVFAMGNSDVPVGQYTSAILTNLGLDEDTLAGKSIISYGSNAKEVTTQVSQGSADCAILFATDACAAGLTPLATAGTELTGGRALYPAAVMSNAQNPAAAKAFAAFLKTPEAMACFEKAGFTSALE